MSINPATYPNLYTYAIFAEDALARTGTITVNEGNWYGTPVSGTGTFVGGTGTPTPQFDGTTATVQDATDELAQLITDIGLLTAGLSLTGNIGTGGTGLTVTFNPNTNYTGTGVTYTTSSITFDAGGVADSQFFITSSSAFTFTDCTFTLSNGASAGNIFWLATGAATGAFTANDSSVPGNIITQADFTATNDDAGSSSFVGQIFSQGAATFTESAGQLSITAQDPTVCYAKGTLILTNRGYIPIEDIHVGYNVVTKGQIYNNESIKEDANLETKPVTWISKFKVQRLNSQSRPICIKKDALGENNPFQDLYVSPGHRVILNGQMVCARDIVNKATIYQDNECESVEYYHLECEEHSAIFANGVLSESFLDFNTKYVFEPVPLIHHNAIQCV